MNELQVITSCDGCCGCCRGRSVPPFTGTDDPEFLSLPEELREELRPALLAVQQPEPEDDSLTCVWLDRETLRCRHYENRPTPCRDFERGSFYCLLFRRKWNVPTP